MDTLGILRIILSILYIANGASSLCSQPVVSYWRQKYESNYDGNDEPEIRCDKDGGYCLSDDGKCDDGDKVHWQTTCEDKCICCFELEQRKTKHWTLMTRRKKTWEDAQDYCRGKRGDLLVPKNIWDVILFLREEDIGRSDVWVGINDHWLGQFEGLYGNYITNGWQYDQPRLAAKKKENCVIIEDEPEDPGMKVEPCDAKNYFICDFSRDAKAKDRHPIFLDEVDPEDFEYGPKKISKWSNWEKYLRKPDAAAGYGSDIVIVPMHLSWKRARAECQSRGGDLHIPISIQDMIMYMRKEMIGSRDVWIGYSDKYTAGVYDGIQSNKIISGWQTGQPVPIEPGDDCVVVEDDKVDGVGMKLEPCSEKHLFICDVSDEWRSHHDTTE